MKQIITQQLAEIERKNDFKILYACETGSRAWGFPSPDSDYDVRFIYVQDLDWHLSLKSQKDSFEKPIDDELDITGWEFKKVLGLMWKSNASLLERIQSPIIYRADQEFLRQINALSHDYFSPVAVMHHYLSMSKKCLSEYGDGAEIRLKKYFYTIRTAICGAWVREKGAIPPIEMHKMFEIIPVKVKEKIEQLIAIKAGKNEDYWHPREPMIDDFLDEVISKNDAIAHSLPAAQGSIEKLDEFYRKIVKGQEHDY